MKLIGIDLRFGCDLRIPQIILCVLVAKIVNVQIKKGSGLYAATGAEEERSQCSGSTITLS